MAELILQNGEQGKLNEGWSVKLIQALVDNGLIDLANLLKHS